MLTLTVVRRPRLRAVLRSSGGEACESRKKARGTGVHRCESKQAREIVQAVPMSEAAAARRFDTVIEPDDPANVRRHETWIPDRGLAQSHATWQMVGRFACTATSCCVADAMCLPLDFIKTRMQLQNEMLPASAPRLGVGGMGAHILRSEGMLAFYSGFTAAMLRQASYGGLCFGAYPLLRDAFSPNTDARSTPMWARILAGGSAGAAASAFANPTDVIKVRLQADGRLVAMGEKPRYTGTMDAIRRITREEGLGAFYKGVGPNVQRATVVNGIGIACYDQSKQAAIALLGEEDSLAARFLAALVGGVATALVGCPFDVLKTRMMNQPRERPLYTNAGQCALAIVRIEGPLALWKGLLPVYCRQAPFNLLNYLIMEQLTLALLGQSM